MSVAAENVLGGLLVDPSAYWRISGIVGADDFPQQHRSLFLRIQRAVEAGEEFDAVTAADEGFDDALTLAGATAGTANIEGWAKRMAGSSETRRVRDAGRRISLCENYGEAQEILAAVRPEQAARVKTARDGVAEMVEALKARFNAGGKVTGVPTGVDSLDELTSGFQPGTLIVEVGETSMGKSTLALIHAIAAAQYGLTNDTQTAVFSLEMTAGEYTERGVANLGDCPLAWITKPASAPDYAMDYIQAGSRAFVNLPLLIDDQCGLSMEQIASRATQMHMQKPLNLMIVDYMHIMNRPRRNDVAELGGIAIGLKNLAKNLHIPVIALHQINRNNASSDRSRRPTIFDIRASGEIAETANTVIAIYRSEVARPDFAPLKGYAEALVLKQRQGRRDVRAWMKSKIGNMRFESCEAPEGYDDTITKDNDESSGGAGGSGGAGRVTSRIRTTSQPRSIPMAGNDD